MVYSVNDPFLDSLIKYQLISCSVSLFVGPSTYFEFLELTLRNFIPINCIFRDILFSLVCCHCLQFPVSARIIDVKQAKC